MCFPEECNFTSLIGKSPSKSKRRHLVHGNEDHLNQPEVNTSKVNNEVEKSGSSTDDDESLPDENEVEAYTEFYTKAGIPITEEAPAEGMVLMRG